MYASLDDVVCQAENLKHCDIIDLEANDSDSILVDGAWCDVTDIRYREFIRVKCARLQFRAVFSKWSSMTCVDVELPVVVWLLARQGETRSLRQR